MNCPAIFITGTDTGVGKSVVAASIAKNMRAGGAKVTVMKPYATGMVPGQEGEGDAALLAAAAGEDFDPVRMSPARFEAPLAPASAAQYEQRMIDHQAILAATRAIVPGDRFSIIEGIGGVAVPLGPNYLLSDFIRELKVPVLIVARTALGTINHSVLTIEHLRARGIDIAGIIFVRHTDGEMTLAEQTGPSAVRDVLEIPNWGTVPYVEGLDESIPVSVRVENLPSDCQAIRSFCDWWREITHPE